MIEIICQKYFEDLFKKLKDMMKLEFLKMCSEKI